LHVPHAAQTARSGEPHAGQKSASAGAACWHRGHCMVTDRAG
jgi:hypothetical protein